MQPKLKKILAFLLCYLLCFQQAGFAQMAAELNIGGYLNQLHSALTVEKFRPLHVRYLSYDNLNNSFRLLLDKGDTKNPQAQELKDTSKTLLNYFFIGLALPNDSFWVNLRPDSESNVIDPYLASTDIGRIMLETDLQLKKDTAKATSPETPEGRKYWDLLYKKAEELFGYENVTIPTLTRPWIVPGEIIIRETTDSAYIYKATLKVMLEEDYLKSTENGAQSTVYEFKDPRLKELNRYSSQLIRELIIPKLTKEVNSSKRYASLRQVYYSLIMAQWFKARFRNKTWSYSQAIDHRNLTNLTSKTPWTKTTYFQEYQKSFKDGEYNIQEPRTTPFGQVIRSYFSGGMELTQLGGAVFSAEGASVAASTRNPHLLALEVRVKEALGLDVGVVIPDEKLLAVQQAHEVGEGHYLGTQNPDGTYQKHQDPHLAYMPEEIARKARILADGGFTKEERRRLIEYGIAGDPEPESWVDELIRLVEAKDAQGVKQIVLETNTKTHAIIAFAALEEMLNEGNLSAAQAVTEIAENKPELITANTVSMLGNIPVRYSRDCGVVYTAIAEIAIKKPELSQLCIWTLATHSGMTNDVFRWSLANAIIDIAETRGDLPRQISFVLENILTGRNNYADYEKAKEGLKAVLDHYLIIIERPPSHIPAVMEVLESALNDRPINSWLFVVVVDAVVQIAEKHPQDIPLSLVSSLVNIFRTSGSPEAFYKPFGEAIAKIGKMRPEMVTPSTVSTLETFLSGEHQRVILYTVGAIAEQRPDLVEQCLSIFEPYIKTEGLQKYGESPKESIYGIIAEAVDKIKMQNPGLTTAYHLLLLPKEVLRHGLPHYQVYLNPYFEETTKGLSEEERYSIALSAYRLLKRYNLELNDTNIAEAVQLITRKREEVSSRDIFSSNRRVINIAHSEERFGLDKMASLAQQAEVAASGISSYKGKQNKQDALEDVGSSSGPLTLFFLGHGGKNHLWLDKGEIGSEYSDELGNPSAISYQELGDRLIQRGSLKEVIILINACYSYNFGVNLISYLAERGIVELPMVVACANFDRVGYGNLLLEGLQASLGEERRTVTMQDVFRAEEHAFEYQDSAIFVPIEPNTVQKHFKQILTSQPQLEEGIDSSKDALPHASLELTGPASSSHNAQLPPAMLEVGFMGANGLVSTGNLDVIGEPADEVINAYKQGALTLPIIVSNGEVEITPWVITINGREINIVINNEQEEYITRSRNGKTISVNAVRINLLLKGSDLTDEERKAAAERILIHELAEAYALQLGRDEADAHHAGLIAEAMHPANSQRIRNALANILIERDRLQAEQITSSREEISKAVAESVSSVPKTDFDKKGGIDGSTSSPSIPSAGKIGGIDFRSLPIVTQAVANLAKLTGQPDARLSGYPQLDLDKEWAEIERLLSAGITPSTERIREYVTASCAQGRSDLAKVILCISDILRLEEDSCLSTEPGLRDILVVLESGRSKQELRQIFLGKTF